MKEIEDFRSLSFKALDKEKTRPKPRFTPFI